MPDLKEKKQREQFVAALKAYLDRKFDLSDTQIFIFGSFLTDEYVPEKSDIDIGIYSENETKMYDIKYELETYLDNFELKYDIVIMHLSDKLLINIPIMIYGTTLTSYEDNDNKMFNYLYNMVKQHGTSKSGLEVINT